MLAVISTFAGESTDSGTLLSYACRFQGRQVHGEGCEQLPVEDLRNRRGNDERSGTGLSEDDAEQGSTFLRRLELVSDSDLEITAYMDCGLCDFVMTLDSCLGLLCFVCSIVGVAICGRDLVTVGC